MSIEKKYYDWTHVRDWVNHITFDMYKDNWRPDYIVGLTRGGLVPAVIMSNSLDIPMHTLKVSLRDGSDPESNLWMSEDAFGWIEGGYKGLGGDGAFDFAMNAKNILIVDDILFLQILILLTLYVIQIRFL